MAPALSTEKLNSTPARVRVGASLLETITCGMYNDPRMVYREYVQNSADAIDDAVRLGLIKPSEGYISVDLDGRERKVTIEDNGSGVDAGAVPEVLGAVGMSKKTQGRHRGFRGIGRLGGMAYCDLVRFETRASPDEPVSVVDWDGRQLTQAIAHSKSRSLESVARGATSIGSRPATHTDPHRFFRVVLNGIRHFHDDTLLNLSGIRAYLSQVAPVAFDSSAFSFATELSELLNEVGTFKTYRLSVNGQDVLRPYSDTFVVNGSSEDEIQDIEFFEVEGADGTPMGKGWFAVTNLLGAIRSSSPVGGLHIREANLQVTTDGFFRRFCTEPRFASWHIGEIHLDAGRLRPNARRDGFEQTADYERLLEQLHVLGRRLSAMCRASSSRRGELRSLRRAEHLSRELRFCVDDEEREAVASELIKRTGSLHRCDSPVSQAMAKDDGLDVAAITAADLQRDLPLLRDAIDGRKLRRGTRKELVEDLCRRVLEEYSHAMSAHDLTERILKAYLK